MPPIIARIIGGAGCGKTTRLLDIMDKTLEAGIRDPLKIGFVSFTRAARREASSRAGDKFGISPHELEHAGWFRTLHSVCYKSLGQPGGLISNTVADRNWLAAAIGEDVKYVENDDTDYTRQVFDSATEADIALGLWDASRNRLQTLDVVWEQVAAIDAQTPDIDFVRGTVDRYEQSKRLDNRLDFCDLLGRFAGWKFDPEGPRRVEPEGDVPGVPVWFFDECQDSSALLHAVELRLMAHARWVYCCGDGFQSIYGFSGSSSKHFMGLQVAKQEILPKSYRCPAPVQALGESILTQCSDYWDREIKPADHEGEVEFRHYRDGVADEVVPGESWLLLARSNFQARRICKTLDDRQIPWSPTTGRGGWDAPTRNAGLAAMLAIQNGEPINGAQWKLAMKLIPSKSQGQELLTRGTKARFEADATELAAEYPNLQLDDLPDVGATPALISAIGSHQWGDFVPGARKFVSAVDRWGLPAVLEPTVRVGTVHSAKGSEADNVVYLTTTSKQVAEGQVCGEGWDEERRVEYVACTRARRRLIVARERTRFKAELPEL